MKKFLHIASKQYHFMQETITNRSRNTTAAKANYTAYRIVAVIDNDNMIKEEQTVFEQCYGDTGMRDRSTAIVLAGFSAREDMEDTLLRWLRRIAGAEQAFSLLSNNYGCHPDGNVYLRILDASKLLNLKNHMQVIEPFLQANAGKQVQWFKTAQISIGTATETLIRKAAYHYAQLSSAERFLITHLCVQRCEGTSFHTISRLALQP